MVGRICPPGGDRVKVSQNLGATWVAPVAPVDTSLRMSNLSDRIVWISRNFSPVVGIVMYQLCKWWIENRDNLQKFIKYYVYILCIFSPLTTKLIQFICLSQLHSKSTITFFSHIESICLLQNPINIYLKKNTRYLVRILWFLVF